jgi:hypothetical protein
VGGAGQGGNNTGTNGTAGGNSTFNPAGTGGEYVNKNSSTGIAINSDPFELIQQAQYGNWNTVAYTTTEQIIALGVSGFESTFGQNVTKLPLFFTDGNTMGMIVSPIIQFRSAENIYPDLVYPRGGGPGQGGGGGAGEAGYSGSTPGSRQYSGGNGAAYFLGTYAGGGGTAHTHNSNDGQVNQGVNAGKGLGGSGGGGHGAAVTYGGNIGFFARGASAGTANTGGGGGGGINNQFGAPASPAGGAGGSGVVVIRYPA